MPGFDIAATPVVPGTAAYPVVFCSPDGFRIRLITVAPARAGVVDVDAPGVPDHVACSVGNAAIQSSHVISGRMIAFEMGCTSSTVRVHTMVEPLARQSNGACVGVLIEATRER